jgi:hypothetical protein
MAPGRKQQVIDLLKSLETKDPVPLARDQWKNSNGKF